MGAENVVVGLDFLGDTLGNPGVTVITCNSSILGLTVLPESGVDQAELQYGQPFEVGTGTTGALFTDTNVSTIVGVRAPFIGRANVMGALNEVRIHPGRSLGPVTFWGDPTVPFAFFPAGRLMVQLYLRTTPPTSAICRPDGVYQGIASPAASITIGGTTVLSRFPFWGRNKFHMILTTNAAAAGVNVNVIAHKFTNSQTVSLASIAIPGATTLEYIWPTAAITASVPHRYDAISVELAGPMPGGSTYACEINTSDQV